MGEAMTADVGVRVVVVSHDSAATIATCLHRLLCAQAVAEVVVVDNASRDDTVAIVSHLARTEPRLRVQAHPDNPGFAVGCNAGALGCPHRWLAFVNPDCYVEVDTFVRLLALADERPGLGALGCVQVDADGVEDAATRRRDPSLREILFARGAREVLHVAADGSPLQTVDALSGAFVLLPTATFVQIGGFDAGYRLHGEDLDLCRRLREAGHASAIANGVCVTHLRGISSRRRPVWVAWCKHRGMWRYFVKFEAGQTAWPMRVLLWGALWVHYALLALPRALLRGDGRNEAAN